MIYVNNMLYHYIIIKYNVMSTIIYYIFISYIIMYYVSYDIIHDIISS